MGEGKGVGKPGSAPPLGSGWLARVKSLFRSPEQRFTRIYMKGRWTGGESPSGEGSSLRQTEILRQELPRLLARLGVRTVLDAACGDFNWMKELRLDLDRYIGIDIVRPLVQRNRSRYGDRRHEFLHLDITREQLPRADLILCRDCLGHLSHQDVRAALLNFRETGSTWLLTTTYPHEGENRDIVSGQWRPLDLERPPFSLPPPHELLHEAPPTEVYRDKSLGLWRLADLRL